MCGIGSKECTHLASFPGPPFFCTVNSHMAYRVKGHVGSKVIHVWISREGLGQGYTATLISSMLHVLHVHTLCMSHTCTCTHVCIITLYMCSSNCGSAHVHCIYIVHVHVYMC